MKFVGLDGDLLRRLVEAGFPDGVAGLLDRWDAEAGAEERGGRRTPNRATVYRWMQGNMPHSRDDLLRLCALLDIDPLCLLAPRGASAERAIEHLLSSFQLDHWKNPALSFLTGFFGRQHDWPPASFARERYGRPWVVRDFDHDPARGANHYALIEISVPPALFSARPHVCHFAYRKPGFFRDRWLEYGIVERFGARVRLFHINGHGEACEADPSEPARVETWFGPGHAVFRAASLHDFELRLVGADDTGRPRVRFPG